MRTNAGAEVPCGECTACCRSSQFVHIGPEETNTIARIPPELLFPAPGHPAGTLVMGYDRNGHCPMLRDNRCSIYEDRPRTCRNYDCRIFAVTGLPPSEDSKQAISEQVDRWQFDDPTERDQAALAAIRASAQFLQERATDLPRGGPKTSPQIALLALKVYELFLPDRLRDQLGHDAAPSDLADRVVDAARQFDATGDGQPKPHGLKQ